jgi:hypothetical protein
VRKFGRFADQPRRPEPTKAVREQMVDELMAYLNCKDVVDTMNLRGSDHEQAQEATRRAYEWMKKRADTYPTLWPMHCDFSAFQVTSVSSERAFSVLNSRVLAKTTNRRSDATLKALMCLGSWMRFSADEDDPLANMHLAHVLKKGGEAKERYDKACRAVKTARWKDEGRSRS